MDEITILQAEVLKTLASPRRLQILHRLAAGACEVGRLAEELKISQPNVSQHLAILRTNGLVEAERDGREVRYRLADPDVMVACNLMRRVLERRLARLAGLAEPARRGAGIALPGGAAEARSFDHDSRLVGATAEAAASPPPAAPQKPTPTPLRTR
jgi:DNA-binding transcriptional ArsR family regulator